MRVLKQIAFILYPFGLAILLPILLAKESHAGRIRHLALNQEQPGVVVLAFGHTTAISFFTKPERVVLGAPNKVQVDFLNKDITVTPLAREPGNVLVYTKSGRYVILFKMGTESSYDDVVEVSSKINSGMHAVRLMEDSYKVINIKINCAQNGTAHDQTEIPATISTSERWIEGEDLFNIIKTYKPLHCTGCIVKFESHSAKITCSKKIRSISCHSANGNLSLERSDL